MGNGISRYWSSLCPYDVLARNEKAHIGILLKDAVAQWGKTIIKFSGNSNPSIFVVYPFWLKVGQNG